MDSKRLLSSLLIAGVLMLAFMYFFRGNGGGAGAGADTRYAIYNDLPEHPRGSEPQATPRTILLGGAQKDDKSKLAIKVDSVTAGIDTVQLNVNDYAATYKKDEPLTLLAAEPGLGKPFSTAGIHITIGNQTQELPLEPLAAPPANATPQSSADAISKANESVLLRTQYIWQLDDKLTQKDAAGIVTDVSLHANFLLYDPTDRTKSIPVARITKHFHLDPTSYEITITHTVENLLTTGETIHVRIDQLAMPALARDDPQTDDRFFHATALNTTDPAKIYVDGDHGYNMNWANLRKAAEADKDGKTGKSKDKGTEYVAGTDGQFYDYAANPQLWVASSNRFFAAVLHPSPEVQLQPATPEDVSLNLAKQVGDFIAPWHHATDDDVKAGAAAKKGDPVKEAPSFVLLANRHTLPRATHISQANIDLMSLAAKPADDVAIVRLTGRTLDVAPGRAVAEPLSVFLGPKIRDLLQGSVAAGGKPEYGDYQYIKLIQFNTCFVYSFCYIDQVAMVILWLLDFLRGHVAFGNYGVAIMILVVAVRALLHPLTRASQVNMAKMGKQMRDVQPKLDAMKKRYPDDKRKQSEEMMRIYRENKINPAGGIMGCLPMLLQTPIWVALYSGLRGDVDLRHSVFIPGWINDLAGPDKILPQGALVMGHPVFSLPLIGDVYGLNLLPLLVAAVFFYQMKVNSATQPKPADEQQAQMQKMSQYMVFLFPVMLYNAPSGLNLYIFASTMAGLLDTYFVRKTLKKQGILPTSAPLLTAPEEPGAEKK